MTSLAPCSGHAAGWKKNVRSENTFFRLSIVDFIPFCYDRLAGKYTSQASSLT